MIDFPHESGKSPDLNRRLKNLLIIGNIYSIPYTNISGITLSSPDDLPNLRDLTAFKMSSSVISALKI